MAEYLQAPPRNPVLGLLSDILASGKAGLNSATVNSFVGNPYGSLLLNEKDKKLPSVPVGDYTLFQAPEFLNNMSYGNSPLIGGSGLQARLDPRALDVLPIASMAYSAGKPIAKTLGKEVARQVETRTGLLGSNVMNPRTNIVPVDNAKGLLQSSTKLAPELKQPFIGYMTKDGFTEMFNHEAAKAADYHHSHLMKDPDKYLDDNALSFVRMGGENVFTVKGNAILDPYKKDSSKQLGILAKKLINEGADPQAPFYVEDLALPKIEAPYQGKQIGTLQDWLKYTK